MDDLLVLKLLAFVLPLGLDSFAMAAAMGARRPNQAQRWRLTAVFALSEAGMPLVGLALGAPAVRLVGPAADYVAAAALIAVGVWMLLSDADASTDISATTGAGTGTSTDGDGDASGEKEKVARMASARGWAMIALGLSISVDELAIGFTIGLAGLPAAAVIIAIAAQALIASQLGLALGARVGEVWRERAERLAGVLLVLLGVGLVADQLIG